MFSLKYHSHLSITSKLFKVFSLIKCTYLRLSTSSKSMPTSNMTRDYSEPHNSIPSTPLFLRTDSTLMTRPASPARSVSSMPTLNTSSSLTCHSRDGSDASSISSYEGPSKFQFPSYVYSSTTDPVSATEANLDQAFAGMSVSWLCIMFQALSLTDLNAEDNS